ncbi:MAG: protein kinase [Acidobacteria bacterium]|nr:protein kinase [Acidobacteriota bacterium]
MESLNTWGKAEEVFAEALKREESQRLEFVRERLQGDEVTIEEVMRLLEAYQHMGDFLDTSVLDFRGEQFGAYRALDEVGRGGMSIVYRGERVDGGFDKQVAIKVVLTQAGMAPETRILAALEHPNIARLLDAGVTSLGFRYLVMEFVEGVPCTGYAPAQTAEAKLRLFLQVCHGVQAAHQSLIVHRDLKPDNILVTSGGQVKLLDFGIAKMLAPVGEQTVGPRAYTIEYASPEQVLGQPASTANDVYSLGVVLFEWLTGDVPRELSGLPLEEALRRMKEKAPAGPGLAGDLELIVRKAMAHDAALRYGSPGALARDLELYLAGKPVLARPATWGYRAQRFLSRHRYSATAAMAAVVALAGTAIYAARQAQLAETRFAQVRTLSRSVLFELHDAVEPLEGSGPARRLIARRSQAFLDAVARDGSASDEVVLDAARGYLRLAGIQASGEAQAETTQGGQLIRRALELARRVVARAPANAQARLVLVDVLQRASHLAIEAGDAKTASGAAREAVTLSGEALRAAPDRVDALSRAGSSLHALARALARSGNWSASRAAAEQSVARRRELAGRSGAPAADGASLAASLAQLSLIEWRAGDPAIARVHAGEAATQAASLHAAATVRPPLHQAMRDFCLDLRAMGGAPAQPAADAQPPELASLCPLP